MDFNQIRNPYGSNSSHLSLDVNPETNQNFQFTNQNQNFSLTPQRQLLPTHRVSENHPLLLNVTPETNQNFQFTNQNQNFSLTPQRQLLSQAHFFSFNLIPNRNNAFPLSIQNQNISKKKSSPRKKTPVEENEVFTFYSEHSYNETIRKYKIGHSRLKKIIINKGKYANKNKTNQDIDNYMIELASSGYLARKIMRSVKKKYRIKISVMTVIRRLRKNGFVYQKLFKVQELTSAHIFLRYNFANLMLNFRRNILFKIVFSDESRFAFKPDNRKRWVKKGDLSKKSTRSLRKYPISVMIWAAIGVNYKSKLYFIDHTMKENDYQLMLQKVGLFKECNKKFKKYG